MTNPTKTEKALEGIDAAARILAERMDYPWSHMPEKGRESMREIAAAVIAAAPQPAQPIQAVTMDDISTLLAHVNEAHLAKSDECRRSNWGQADSVLARIEAALSTAPLAPEPPQTAQPSAVELPEPDETEIENLARIITLNLNATGFTGIYWRTVAGAARAALAAQKGDQS